ncbi:WD40-repeat-containing domain protein [Mucor mucedo]|uniref:WD40-repeat-containing domain protein n=1 Tax=Mucor mucedo TaxID=29922 RepID=UPI00221E77EF|nr:WD40-repeat-containing domain protein [Mucor mucedo]KAI7871378.1 WD40-repeat-containing domain protein [Mucor mucedo]
MATGAVVKVLSQSPTTGGHTNKITRVILNPKNHLQLYTASLDGTIKLWDYNDDILLKTYNVNAPIQFMVMSPEQPGHAYLVVDATEAGADKSADNTIVYRFSFGSSDEPTHMRRICSLRDCTTIDITQDGQWLAFGARFKAYVWPINNDLEDVHPSQLQPHVSIEPITVLKIHPSKPMLALGDKSGRITLISNFKSSNEKEHIRSTHHWHHLPVRCLAFLADGAYLLSGGEEAVVVIWQLDTGHKQFLPRLGGSIDSITISPNNRFYCLGLDDNSIRLVNSITQSIEQVIQGLQYAQVDHATNPLSTGLIIEPRNHHIVLNGVQGSIQFYDANADKHVMDLEVVPMNRISRTSTEKEIIHAHVAHVAFLKTGEWMATVDMRDDKVTTPELFLKFWRWNPDTQAYTLHTRVDYPHAKPITSLIFNPVSTMGPMAITTSEDKTFKVWHLNTDLANHGNRAATQSDSAWVCRSVGVYRDSNPTSAAFSEDGSILAVAFGQVITLWDPYSNSIQNVLAQPTKHAVLSLSFLGDQCPFLIAKTKNHLYVWNLLTCKVWWSYKISVDHLAIDTVSNQFAVVRNHHHRQASRITIFDPKSPIPIALQHLDHACLAVTWLPKDDGDDHALPSTLVSLSNRYELVIHTVKSTHLKHNSKKDSKTSTPSTTATPLPITEETHLLNDMYGMRENERETEEEARIRLKTVQTMREEAMSANRKESKMRRREEGDVSGLAAPSHVLPSVDVLFDTFMTSIMSLRVEEEEEETNGMEMDVDEEEEEENTQDENGLDILVTQSPSVDFPSLTTFFSQELEQTSVQHKSTTAQSSSDEDSEEDEDPSKIAW